MTGSAWRDGMAGLAATGIISWATSAYLDTTASVVPVAVSTFTVIMCFLLGRRPALATADRITLGRGVLIAVIAGHLAETAPTPVQSVGLVALTLLALALDGLDGFVARRQRQSTPFGARFDMEMDALLILVLCLLLWRIDRVGAWILAIGLMRYVFVAATRLIPALNRPLPESRRRKVICVTQGAAMPVCLLPFFPAHVVSAVALTALSLLGYSFLVDTLWLTRHARHIEEQEQLS